MSPGLLGVLLALSSQAPVLPPRCTAELYRLYYEIQQALQGGEFSKARELLKGWTYGEVKYFWEVPLPEAFQGADRDAGEMWREASGNRIRFLPAERGDEPGVLVRLKPVSGSVVEVRLPYWEKGQLVAEIPIQWGPLQQNLSKVEIIRAIARAFGVAVGLAPTRASRGVMVSHLLVVSQPSPFASLEGNVPLFTDVERERIDQILDVREELEKIVSEERKITPAVPRLEISPLSSDAGYVRTGQVPRFELRLKNTGNAPLFIVPEVSCGCILLDKIDKLAPGEEVVVTAAMDTKDLVGKITKDITFHSNDLIQPHQTVFISAVSSPEYRIVPETTDSFVLNDEGETKIDLYFCVMTETPIKLLNVIPGDPRVKVSFEAWAGELVDLPFGEKPVRRMGYHITLTFPESIEAGTHWFDLLLKTDSMFMPNKMVNIQAQKGLFFIPRGFYFGGVALQPGAVRAVTLLHPSQTFRILSVNVEGEGFEVTYEPMGQAPGVTQYKQYLLKATYKGGLQGAIHAVVVVTTDHPRYPVIKIPITGSILGGENDRSSLPSSEGSGQE